MEPLRKYLLDANIYGELAVDSEVDKVVREYELCKAFVLIYGVNEIIRKELRATPKGEKVGVKKLRISLLALYDALAGKHELLVTDEHRLLAGEYHKAYAGFGGSKPKHELSNDFLLVACASAKGMDVVVSDDEKTLLTENAVKAYRLVNDLRKLRTPRFIGYGEFKLELRNCALRSGAPDEFVGGSDKFRILLIFLNFLSQHIQLRFPYRYLFSLHNAFIRISAYLNVLFGRQLSGFGAKGVFLESLAN